MRIVLTYTLCFICFCVIGQPTQADFLMPSNACLQEKIKVDNLSTNAGQNIWDLCSGDLNLAPTATVIANNYGGYGTRVEIKEASGQFFGFFLSGGSKSLYRLNFGISLNNTPTLTNLGDLGLNTVQLRAVDIVFDGGMYYGFVVDGQLNKVYRIDFGNSLSNSPTNAVEIFSGSPLNFPFQISSVSDGSLKYLFIGNQGDGKLVRLKFPSSYSDVVSESFAVPVTTNWINGVSFLKSAGRWYCITGSPLLASIQKVDFVNGLGDNAPVVTTIAIPSNPIGVELVNENGNYYAFAQSRNATMSLFRVDFGTSMTSTPTITDLSGVGYGATEIGNYSMYNYQSTWVGFAAQTTGLNVYQVKFPNLCVSSSEYVTTEEPDITTMNSGTFKLSLTTTDTDGNFSYKTQTLTVSATTAPDVDISTDGTVCENSDVVFTAANSSGNINAYNWSFGAATSPATHQFTSAGDFDVSLQVAASNGCQNYVEKVITIYNEPSPDFSLPPNNPLCSNQEYVFDNTSTVDVGAPVTWQWQVNGVNESTTEDLTFAFANAMSQDVKLIAAIPGCQNEKTLTVNSLIDGPIVDFSFLGSCQSDQVAFTNNSIGAITGFDWDFGDGQGSISTDPNYSYANAGNYNVKLTAFGQSGCNNSTIKPVTIHSKPQVNFYVSPPPFSCSGTVTNLNDLTPNPTDSNLDTWQWNFGDAGNSQNTSTNRNPQHTYSTAGVYDVTLTVTTNFQCSATLQLPVTISQSPVADFTVTHLCEDLPTNFLDNSIGTITGWSWQMGSSFYSGSNTATHTFVNSGNASASLTVTASNGCIASVTKPLVVPAKPNPDFSVFKNCTNQQTLFTDITNSPADPIASRSWNFGGLGNSFESPTTFTFNNTGNVNVTVNVLTQSGCGYSRTKVVSIVGSPTASFTATPNIGAPPLEVQFTNTSINATNYLWEFNDENNSSDTDPSPSFTYSTLGQYEAQLTAFNALNCSHTASQQINVLIPFLSVALNGLELMEVQSGEFKPAVTILNNGNIPLTNVQLLLNINGPVVRERVDAIISPHASYRHMLQFEIPQNYLDYFCIEVEVDDDDENDNLACMSLDRSFTVFEPHPNPAHGQLNVSWILKEDGMVKIELLNSMGQSVTDFQVDSQEGLTPLTINTMGMSAGVYILKVHYRHISKVYRILISE